MKRKKERKELSSKLRFFNDSIFLEDKEVW